MTKTILPPWRNDRLPTQEDADEAGDVGEYRDETYKRYKNQILQIHYSNIKDGQYWFEIGDISYDLIWTNALATPQECLAIEKGEDKVKSCDTCGYDFIGDNTTCSQCHFVPSEDADDRFNKVLEERNKSIRTNKDLKQALAEENTKHTQKNTRGN